MLPFLNNAPSIDPSVTLLPPDEPEAPLNLLGEALILIALVLAFLAGWFLTPSRADELGPPVLYSPKPDAPWGDVPVNVLGTWFESLTNEIGGSCCGLGDAYEADLFETEKGGAIYAVITDGREFAFHKRSDPPDVIHKRREIKEGTRVYIPATALTHSKGNPTGHGVVFISQGDLKTVYCFVLPALI